jgi:hypothetical protein
MIPGLSQAQLPWKIKLGSKTILQTTGVDANKNIVKIKASQLRSKNNLVLSFTMPADEKDWVRTIMIDDSTGAGVTINPPAIKKGKTVASFTVSGKKLKEYLTKHRKIQFFYISIPSDPKKAMLVRVSKAHICTISL